MTPFFDGNNLGILEREAQRWLGTPFSANGDTCQVGVSCQKLAAGIYHACGMPAVDVPSVPMGHARFDGQVSLVHSYMETRADFFQIPTTEAWIGDMVCFRIRNVVHHIGIVVRPGIFLHACEGMGVVYSLLSDATWSKRLSEVWRPIK